MRDEQDIEILHAKVIDEYHGTHASGDALDALQRMTSFVVRAAIRLAELREALSRDAPSPAAGPKKSLAPRGS
jgi:hypothetical protein